VDNLSAAERLVWEAFPRGDQVDLRSSDSRVDDSAGGREWCPERTVRAEVLKVLLLGARTTEPGYRARLALVGARIAGALDISDAEIGHPLALTGCRFDTTVSLTGTKTHRLDLSGSLLPGLNARQIRVDGDLSMRGCHIHGGLRLGGARISGRLQLHGAKLRNPEGPALDAPRLTIDHSIYCAAGFVAEGEIRLVGSSISGGLHMSNVQLINPGGDALEASRTTIGDDLNLIDDCVVEGHVRLVRTHINGLVDMSGARISNPGDIAVSADNLTVDHNLFCGNGFTAEGEVRLLGAHIAGDLVLRDARLSNPDGFALDAGSLSADRGIQCDQEFTAQGAIRLIGAKTDVLVLLPAIPLDREIDLRCARVGTLLDDPVAWPATARLDGLVYDTLDPLLSVEDRLTWLGRQPGGYLPQPYEQLAITYRRLGHDSDARRVLLAKQRRRRRTLTLFGKAWGVLQDWTVGYGYLPGRAATWLFALLTVGTVVFWVHPPAQVHSGPHFNPFLYTLDVLLPIVHIGQKDAFVPVSAADQWLTYALTATGWLLATTITTAITRSLTRT
jgi:hypothetical protein